MGYGVMGGGGVVGRWAMVSLKERAATKVFVNIGYKVGQLVLVCCSIGQ